jgi:putative transposase
MKKSKFTEEQILFALKQADAGQAASDVCRQMGISEATFYNWKKRFGNLGLPEVRELRQLRDENARLKRLVADLTLDRHVLQEVIKKRSSGDAAPGDRAMASGMLPIEHPTLVPADVAGAECLVLPLARPRQQWAAAADARARHGAAALRVRAPSHSARPRRLASRPKPRTSALQAGGPAGSNESASAQANQSASRADAYSHPTRRILGDGFRT